MQLVGGCLRPQRKDWGTCGGSRGPPTPTHPALEGSAVRGRTGFGSRGWCTGAQLDLQVGPVPGSCQWPPPPPALSWEADRGWGGVLSTAMGQHSAPLLKTTETALLSSLQEPLRQRPAKANSDQRQVCPAPQLTAASAPTACGDPCPALPCPVTCFVTIGLFPVREFPSSKPFCPHLSLVWAGPRLFPQGQEVAPGPWLRRMRGAGPRPWGQLFGPGMSVV